MKMNFSELAKNYKRKISNSFLLVNGDQIGKKISGEDFCATRKIDGTMQLLLYRDGEAVAVSTSGKEQRNLPCLAEFASLVEKAGLTSATAVGELYAVLSDTGRERVCDVATAIADKSLNDKLRLAVFDIVDLDEEPLSVEHYREKHAHIVRLFSGKAVHPVEAQNATSKEEVAEIYKKWVTEGGAEGVVLHTESSMIYKIKPRHSVDAVVVGYTCGDAPNDEAIRDIMVAVVRPDGLFQQFAVTGTGFTQHQRQEFYALLAPKAVESDFIETDSRNVAFQMVRPEVVVELSSGDYVAEDSFGNAKMNALLRYDSAVGYVAEARVAGVAAHHLNFVRIREDKGVNAADLRISQITDICPFSARKEISYANLPESEQLYRRVFVKRSGEKVMIQKFLVWSTHKEQSGIFPAYVFHYTDFSVGRKEPLKRDIRVSSSREQILSIAEEFVEANIKKGWVEWDVNLPPETLFMAGK